MLLGLLAPTLLMLPLGPLCITQTVCTCFAFVSLSECENLVLPMYYKSKFIKLKDILNEINFSGHPAI